ncbi:MAG: DUF5317 domain-containing protein [Firmicutes bacterium]|nr:DUF5317 domain-containing protein [Bacillota bacterium]
MIPVGVFLSVVVAKLRGGKFDRLHDLGIKGLPWVWAALLLRALVGILARRSIDVPWLQIVAYLIFFYALIQNMSLPGLKLFIGGSALNFLAIAFNGGAMPVSPVAIAFAGLQQGDPMGTHCLLTPATRLWFLADVIPLRSPYFPLPQVISIGDIFIVVGIFYFIQRKMLATSVSCARQE